jgi:hypothetical protein
MKETSYSDRRFWFSYYPFIIIIGGILVLFIYITRLASNEIFSPSNKIHREISRAKDLSATLYITRLAPKEIFSPSNKIHRGVGRAKNLSAPLYQVALLIANFLHYTN